MKATPGLSSSSLFFCYLYTQGYFPKNEKEAKKETERYIFKNLL